MPYFRGVNKFKNLEIVPGGSLMGYAPHIWGSGAVFYVDTRSWGIGSDARSGTNPNEPLATIAAAFAKCTTEKNDYIIVIDGYDNDTYPITINKKAVHIIGVNGGNPYPYTWLTGAAGVFSLTGNSCEGGEIAGLFLNADATHPCITMGAEGNCLMHIHHVGFAPGVDTSVARDGFLVPAAMDAVGVVIEDCVFGNQAGGGGIGRDGIRFESISCGIIRRNKFKGCVAIAIHDVSVSGVGCPDILDNLFFQKTTQETGSSIEINRVTNGIIDGNRTVSNAGHAGNNPYVDLTTGTDTSTKNGWGVNWLGDTVKYPAVT